MRGGLRGGHRNTNATRSTRSTPALLSDSVARGAAARGHPDSAPIGKIAQREVLSRTIDVDDTRSLQDTYEAVLRKAPASRTLEELQLLVGWAKQIEFKDEEVKKAVKLEQLCQAMRLQDTELDELVCKQGDEVRDAILPPSHLARVRPLVALLVSS